MRMRKTLLALSVAGVLLAGCKKQDDAATEAVAAPATPAAAGQAPAPASVAEPATATPAAPTAALFDIGTIALSDKPLPAWPYVAMPAGHHYYHSDGMAGQSKDLARVPLWTGGQLVWVEGKVFEDSIRSDDGKTYSQFEVRKNLRQAIEALGGVRLTERSYDQATYDGNEKALDDFRQEFDRIRDAYWYDADADTYVIRRADKAVWVVLQTGNGDGGILVAEGPLPDAPAE